MQNKKLSTVECILLSVPTDLLSEAEISEGGILQMRAENGRLIIETADVKDYVCSGDCENCPLSEFDCDGDCEDCPCSGNCDEGEVL